MASWRRPICWLLGHTVGSSSAPLYGEEFHIITCGRFCNHSTIERGPGSRDRNWKRWERLKLPVWRRWWALGAEGER
jgi:hypothetical protein